MSRIEPWDLPRYRIEDYRLWQGDWELISGLPVAMAPSPMVTHQSVCREITVAVANSLEECPQCEVYYEIDWVIDEENVVRPDIIVVCESEDSEYITKTPGVIFEVISKSTAHNDRVLKYRIYEEEGVRYYVIVDPESRLAKVYLLQDGRYGKYKDARSEAVEFALDDCSFSIDFSKIWQGVK